MPRLSKNSLSSLGEVEARRGGRRTVRAVDDRRHQTGVRDLLHAAVRQREVARVLVGTGGVPAPVFGGSPLETVRRSTGTTGHGVGDRGGRLAIRRGGTDVAVHRQNHLGIAVRGVAIDRIAERARGGGGNVGQGDVIPVVRIGRGRSDDFGDEVRGLSALGVRGAAQHLGGAQHVGHHAHGDGHTVSRAGLQRGGGIVLSAIFLGTAGSGGDSLGIFVVVVAFPDLEGERLFLEVIHAADPLGFALRSSERGEEHGRENRDDRDHDEQFDKRKRLFLLVQFFHLFDWLIVLLHFRDRCRDLSQILTPSPTGFWDTW